MVNRTTYNVSCRYASGISCNVDFAIRQSFLLNEINGYAVYIINTTCLWHLAIVQVERGLQRECFERVAKYLFIYARLNPVSDDL